MPRAAENAALYGIPDAGQTTGRSTSTMSPPFARALVEASSGHMLRPKRCLEGAER